MDHPNTDEAPTSTPMGNKSVDNRSLKVRKPYPKGTVHVSWKEIEREKFVEAINLFGRDWQKITEFVGTKNVIQIRSHGQKYLSKAEKKGFGFPLPRPKRKASHLFSQITSGQVLANNCSTNTKFTPRILLKANHNSSIIALPNFTLVNDFMASVFDQCTADLLQKLNEMELIDVETVLLSMRHSEVKFKKVREVVEAKVKDLKTGDEEVAVLYEFLCPS